jgi:hypothetical protein
LLRVSFQKGLVPLKKEEKKERRKKEATKSSSESFQSFQIKGGMLSPKEQV